MRPGSHGGAPHLRIDGGRLMKDLGDLAEFGRLPSGGVSRVAYSPADQQARRWIEAQMRTVGMQVEVDAAGNSIGSYPGADPAAKPIALGSHTDSVPDGGRYDGALGVLGALACVRALQSAEIRMRHPVEVINFAAEEATMAGTLGSRAMAGQLSANVLSASAWDGRPVSEHLTAAGIDPATVGTAERPKGSLAAFLELHIEQGGTLEADGVAIGVVHGIVGIRRYVVSFEGRANHAGTTPMALRDDALVAAAPFVVAVRDIAAARGIVGTVGALRIHPGASNVIPGRVDADVEIRSLDDAVLDAAERDVAAAAGRRATTRRLSSKAPVILDAGLVRVLEDACGGLGLSYRSMSSGAGHDAMSIAAVAPAVMVFVPSRGGISHAPEEFTEPERCIAGADVLLSALLTLDAAL